MNEIIKRKHPLMEPLSIGGIGVSCLILVVFTNQFFIVAIFLFYLLLVGFLYLYMKAVMKVKWDISQNQQRLFMRESGACTVQIINEARFPIFKAALQFRSNEQIEWETDQKMQRSHHSYHIPLQIEGRDMITITLGGNANERGRQGWQAAELMISDPFGLITYYLPIEQKTLPEFHILPQMSKVTIPEMTTWKHGFRRAAVSPLYDETKIVGVKEYEGESFRSIHWGATAKTGVISAKKYEYTQGDRYALYVNVLGQTGYTLRTDMEYLIQVAAGVCRELISQDCSFELWINGVREQGVIHLKGGKHRKQLYKAMDLLSSLTEKDTPLNTHFFYQTGFRRQEAGCIPLIIGYPPEKQKGWIQIVK
ncbi:DUF58 domain-containing protein [Bacillus pseudomycoides]|uniref:DUF58 domain-containing protein n=1 Tax=Bacillus pseudomycoides TaxID=64104 RepID=UPI000BF1281C|nr:DUF58 domain-containing protein [Bacillus pseudomycoides]PEJ35349.1 hypothetical protein CN677_12505 [Bacillus pseudomycoides]PGE97863.1 hypothetical protein COM62_06850 [Bacillus pseudomycoides]PHA96380.1 hypothetical protein COE78_06300 [Bacillus pseudomycoides]PHB22496.1 hypothetical protein COE80_19980 [Bacillus pseudomycoides]PHC68275.1 hypothetical protein COF38_26880 [Bacillus pseudomycoides]